MLVVTTLLFFLGSTSAAFFKFYDEGKNATLECTAGTGDVLYWFLHGKGKAINNLTETQENVFLNSNGDLEFRNVSKTYEGNHVCVVQTHEHIESHWVEMKVKPLPPVDLWEYQYKRMFVTAFISALICLLLFVGFCLVKHYRWREPLTKVPRSKAEDGAYSNPAMEDNDDFEYNIRM